SKAPPPVNFFLALAHSFDELFTTGGPGRRKKRDEESRRRRSPKSRGNTGELRARNRTARRPRSASFPLFCRTDNCPYVTSFWRQPHRQAPDGACRRGEGYGGRAREPRRLFPCRAARGRREVPEARQGARGATVGGEGLQGR